MADPVTDEARVDVDADRSVEILGDTTRGITTIAVPATEEHDVPDVDTAVLNPSEFHSLSHCPLPLTYGTGADAGAGRPPPNAPIRRGARSGSSAGGSSPAPFRDELDTTLVVVDE